MAMQYMKFALKLFSLFERPRVELNLKFSFSFL